MQLVSSGEITHRLCRHCTALGLLAALLIAIFPCRAGADTTLLLDEGACQAAGVEQAAVASLKSSGGTPLPRAATAAAVGRARARRSLEKARQLYTRTSFTKCASILSVAELQLFQSLGEANAVRREKTLTLLAEVLLWLGVCQWTSGQQDAATEVFIRAAQLPAAPVPDPSLLPPALMAAYRNAIATPRREVSCSLEPPLSASELQVDGRGPTISADAAQIVLPEGSHYLLLRPGSCSAEPCNQPQRLQARAGRCRIQLSTAAAEREWACLNRGESGDLSFVAAVAEESEAQEALIVEHHAPNLAVKLYRKGPSTFQHQVSSRVDATETPADATTRTIKLLGGSALPNDGGDKGGTPWYTKWWVWTIAGTVVAAVAVTVAVTASNDGKTVVFGQ